MNKLNRPVHGLAEISLRVHDLDAMQENALILRHTLSGSSRGAFQVDV